MSDTHTVEIPLSVLDQNPNFNPLVLLNLQTTLEQQSGSWQVVAYTHTQIGDFYDVNVCEECSIRTGIDGKHKLQLSQEATTNKLQAFPNPFSGSTTLQFLATVDGMYRIDIMNISGQIIHSQSSFCEHGSNRYELSSAILTEAGIYYVRLTAPDGNQERIAIVKALD